MAPTDRRGAPGAASQRVRGRRAFRGAAFVRSRGLEHMAAPLVLTLALLTVLSYVPIEMCSAPWYSASWPRSAATAGAGEEASRAPASEERACSPAADGR